MRRIEYKQEQRAVSKLVDEFRRTGALRVNVPAEVDIVHRVVAVHQDERRWNQERKERLASKLDGAKVEAPAEPSIVPDESPATLPFVSRDTRRGNLSPGVVRTVLQSLGEVANRKFSVGELPGLIKLSREQFGTIFDSK